MRVEEKRGPIEAIDALAILTQAGENPPAAAA